MTQRQKFLEKLLLELEKTKTGLDDLLISQRSHNTINKNNHTVRTYVRKKHYITNSDDKHPPHNKPIFYTNNPFGGVLL